MPGLHQSSTRRSIGSKAALFALSVQLSFTRSIHWLNDSRHHRSCQGYVRRIGSNAALSTSRVQIPTRSSSIHCLNSRQRSCQEEYVRTLHDEALVQKRRLCSHHRYRFLVHMVAFIGSMAGHRRCQEYVIALHDYLFKGGFVHSTGARLYM